MLERYLVLLPHVNSVLASSAQTDWILSKSEVQELRDLCLLLKPCKELTELVSGSAYVTISLVRCQFKILINQIGSVAANTKDAVSATAHKMVLDLNHRLGPLSRFMELAIASDPRTKNYSHFLSRDEATKSLPSELNTYDSEELSSIVSNKLLEKV